MCYNLEKYQTFTNRKVWHMIKTLALDTPNIKITDNDTPIKLTPYDDGVKVEAGTWVPKVYIASNTSAFTKSIPAIWDGDKVVIQSSTLADLPVDKYDVEVWLNDGSEQLIYPDYGYVKLNINQTVAGINANLISSVTVAEFRDMFNSLATDVNASIADLAVDSEVVHKTGNETVADTKTFSSPIIGSLTGNASTSTKLSTPRKLKVNLASTADQTFDGSADQPGIGVSGLLPVNSGGSGNAFGSSQMIEAPSGIASALSFTLPTGLDGKSRTWSFTASGSSSNGFPDSQTYTGFLLGGTSSNRFRWFAMADNTHIWYTAVGNYTRTGDTYTINSVAWTKYADDNAVTHQAIGTVIMNSSSSASGELTGTWSNIGSATIGTTVVYYWQRTA